MLVYVHFPDHVCVRNLGLVPNLDGNWDGTKSRTCEADEREAAILQLRREHLRLGFDVEINKPTSEFQS